MHFALVIEPQQGLTYERQLALAAAAQRSRFEAFFRSDHYSRFHGRGQGLPTDAWTALAGIAREVPHIRLGALVSPITFRRPGSFAAVIATVTEMSGNRVEVGLGTGWHPEEHAAMDIPFPAMPTRYAMLEAQLQRLTQPEQTATALFDTSRPLPHLIVGGSGKRRSVELAARYADEYNLVLSPGSDIRIVRSRLDDAASRLDRPTPVLSVATGFVIGDRASVTRRLELLPAELGGGRAAVEWLQPRLDNWLVGNADEVADRIHALEQDGVERIILQDFLPDDLDHITAAGEILFSIG